MDIFNISGLEIKSVVKAENKKTDPQYIQYNKSIDFYQLIYVLNGKAEVVFDDTVITNSSGTVVFLPTGDFVEYRAKILEDEDCIAVFFNACFEKHPTLTTQNFVKNQKLCVLFEKIYTTWLHKEPGYYNKCKSLFYSIMAEIELSLSKYVPSSKCEKIIPAVEYIHRHYTDSKFPYDKLPSLCNISYTYFKKLFAERYFMTPSEYVKKLKIQRARELLKTKNFSVSDVAELCGFSDVYYFSRVFKNYIGCSPSEYIKNAHL